VADSHLCFPAGTAIMTASGAVDIEKISVGDSVLTHTGRFMPVDAVSARPYSGELVGVSAKGHPTPVLSTESHPYLVRTESGGSRWIEAKDLQPGHLIAVPRIQRESNAEITVKDWLEVIPDRQRSRQYEDATWLEKAYQNHSSSEIARHCGVDQAVVLRAMRRLGVAVRDQSDRAIAKATKTLPAAKESGVRLKLRGIKSGIPGRIRVTRDIAWMLGLYLAEGHVGENGFVFSLNSNESNLAARINVALAQIGVANVKPAKGSQGSTQWYSANATFSRLLVEMFGTGASGKRIPSQVLEWSRDLLACFIAGYLAGDGSFTESNGTIQWTTVSRSLQSGVRLALTKLGVPCSVFEYQRETSGTIQGRSVSLAPIQYCGAVYADSSRVFFAAAAKVSSSQKPRLSAALIDDDFVWRPVSKVFREQYFGSVYNMEVRGDHSYVTDLCAVHNCANVLNPLITMMSQVMTMKIAPRYRVGDSERLYIWIEECKPFDADLRLAEIQTLAENNNITGNEMREAFGLEPRDGLDEIPEPVEPIAPAADDPEPTKKPPAKKPTKDRATDRKLEKTIRSTVEKVLAERSTVRAPRARGKRLPKTAAKA
jgi:ribonucleoside-diphosphate reductase alpha chain